MSLTGKGVAFLLEGGLSLGAYLSGEGFAFLLEGGPSSIGLDLNARVTFLHKVFLFIITCWPANAATALSTALRRNFSINVLLFLYDQIFNHQVDRTTLDPVIQLIGVGSIKRAHSVVSSLCVVYFVCL